MVARRVEEYFQRPSASKVNPDEVVAMGAALQAAALTKGHARRAMPTVKISRKDRDAALGVAAAPPAQFGAVATVVETLPDEATIQQLSPPVRVPLPPGPRPSPPRAPPRPGPPRPAPRVQSVPPPITELEEIEPELEDLPELIPDDPEIAAAIGAPSPPEPPPPASIELPLPSSWREGSPAPEAPSNVEQTIVQATAMEAVPEPPVLEPMLAVPDLDLPVLELPPLNPPVLELPPLDNPLQELFSGHALEAISEEGQAPVAAEQRSFGSTPPRTAPLLIDVTPISLGVEVAGGFCDFLIRANTPVPCDRTRMFRTASDGQSTVQVRVFQGESSRFSENTYLGDLELSGLRPAPRGEVEINVTFEIDADGILNVRATEPATGKETIARINLLGAQSDKSEVAAMIARQRRHNVA